MGTLRIKRYPTVLALGLADHAYVECGTGRRAWGCFGGKTGGTVAVAGAGSTRRADMIAGPKETGGLACYLINGVCHQAANRIALPAGITATRATVRGYGLSEALFGTYGRPRGFLGLCRSPFNQFPGVTGDLPECAADTNRKLQKVEKKPPKKKSGKIKITFSDPEAERQYQKEVQSMYSKSETMFSGEDGGDRDQLVDFQTSLFMLKARHHLGGKLNKAAMKKLADIRRNVETARITVEDAYFHAEPVQLREYAQIFNILTDWFQHEIANHLKKTEYQSLFGTVPGEIVRLADPEIVERIAKEHKAG